MKATTALRSILICVGSSLLGIFPTSAAILYYDGGTVDIVSNGNSAASAITGNWDTITKNWDAGFVPYVAWNNANNDIAFFNAGTAFPAPTPGTVILNSAITVGGLIFNTSGYTISGSTLTFGGTSNTVALNNLVTAATINSAIGTSNANMTFTAQNPIGAATLTFGAAGGWTGSTTVNAGLTLQTTGASSALLNTSGITLNGGTIIQSYTAAVHSVNDAATITSTGGTFATSSPNSAITLTEVIGPVTLNSGLTTFAHNASGASLTSQNLILSDLTRTGAANTSVVNFAANGGLNTTKNIITVTGSTATAAGRIIGPWATTGNTTGANDYAVYDASSRVVPANMPGTGEASWTISTDSFKNEVVTQTLAATRTITALRNTAATATLTLATGANLETYGILNGATTAFTVAATGTGALTTPTGGGHLHLNAGNGTTGGIMTISAPITNNGGTVAVVKSGLGTLNLSGNNTYTGGIVVNSGTVSVTGTNTYATGAAGADVINGGVLTYTSTSAWGGTGRDVTFNGTGTLTSAPGYTGGTLTSNTGANAIINEPSAAGILTFATTTGAGNIIFNVASTGTRRLELGDASGFTGTLQMRLSNSANQTTNTNLQFSAIGDAVGSALQFAGGTGDSNQAVTIAYNGTAALTFNNRQIQILQRLASNNVIRDNILANNSADAAHTWTINTDLLNNGGRAGAFGAQAARQLVLSGSNTGNNAFNGLISDGQGQIRLTKAGIGTWIVSGINTYTGSTVIDNGTLLVNSPGSLHALSAVAVNGGTLGGNGTIGGSVTLAAAGSLAPGASAGTLTIGGNLDVSALANGGTGKLRFELATPAASDHIDVTGTLTIGTGALGISDFIFTDLGGLQTGYYTLIASSGGIIGTLDPTDLSITSGLVTKSIRINGNNLEVHLNTDSDNDGMPDSFELAHTTPPSATALDPGDDLENSGTGDGLTNLQEYQHGTNPFSPDTDADGISDGAEVNHPGSFYKFFPGSFTYTQAAVDAAARHGRVASFPDAADYSRMAAKARLSTQGYVWIGLSDAATEGTWRWTDGSTATYSRWLAGQPSGGVAENHVVIMQNTTLWADTTENFVAAGYLFERVGLDPLNADSDADGLTDSQELNTTLSNPLLDDTDGDGLLDGAEVNTHGSSPLLTDTDSDGINDQSEVLVYQTNPSLADSDADGFDDLFEINTGFDPTLNTSTPDALTTNLTAVELRSYGLNGVSYRIESSTDLETWATVEPTIIGTGAVITRFYSIENQPRRYFRVIEN